MRADPLDAKGGKDVHPQRHQGTCGGPLCLAQDNLEHHFDLVVLGHHGTGLSVVLRVLAVSQSRSLA